MFSLAMKKPGEKDMANYSLRASIAFFIVTFSIAFLMTIGIRLTGWFTHVPVITPQATQDLGIAIMAGVLTLVVGFGIRRMGAHELRSALLGAASVLLAIPTSASAILHTWEFSYTLITVFGFVALGIGLLVSVTWANAPTED